MAKLPDYVYLAKGRYVYRPYLGRVDGKVKFGKEVRLCGADASVGSVWRVYESIVAGKNCNADTIGWLMDLYMGSDQFKRLSQRTQEDYEKYARSLRQEPVEGTTFEHINIGRVTLGSMQSLHDRLTEKGPVTANRKLSFLRSVFKWGMRREHCASNPAAGVEKTPERPRDRLVTPEEFWHVHDAAPLEIQIAMRLAAALRARLAEVLKLEWKDVDFTKGAIRLRRAKGSKTQDIIANQFLAETLQLARDRKVVGIQILQKRFGGKFTASGFQTAWQRLWDELLEKDPTLERFTFHDLKAAGVSYFDGDKLKASGHRTARMLGTYDRAIESVDASFFRKEQRLSEKDSEK